MVTSYCQNTPEFKHPGTLKSSEYKHYQAPIDILQHFMVPNNYF